ncbi:MAG: ribosome-associated translation inhibitor RaiA [Clostridia bacterium]|nr:ribosome-associated translation inhibitor RaiA [Clostridia bacterium]
MKINVTERKIRTGQEIRDYAEKKCRKLERYFGKEVEAFVRFSKERDLQTVEITLQDEGLIFRAQEKTRDLFAGVDACVASIDRQIQKNKTRLARRLRDGSFAKAVPEMTDYRDETFEIVREKTLDIKPMTVEDAIMQMNLLGHAFFFFVNSEKKNTPCVVYSRKDGGYGLLIAK